MWSPQTFDADEQLTDRSISSTLETSQLTKVGVVQTIIFTSRPRRVQVFNLQCGRVKTSPGNLSIAPARDRVRMYP